MSNKSRPKYVTLRIGNHRFGRFRVSGGKPSVEERRMELRANNSGMRRADAEGGPSLKTAQNDPLIAPPGFGYSNTVIDPQSGSSKSYWESIAELRGGGTSASSRPGASKSSAAAPAKKSSYAVRGAVKADANRRPLISGRKAREEAEFDRIMRMPSVQRLYASDPAAARAIASERAASRVRKQDRKRKLLTITIGGTLCIIIIVALLASGISKLLHRTNNERIAEEAGNQVTLTGTQAGAQAGEAVEMTEKGFPIETEKGVTRVGGIIIANKTFSLPEKYGDGLTEETQAAFNDMKEAAGEEGIPLAIVSGFRSYEEQKTLFEGYVDKDGIENAETYSARPGHSEHQIGEAMDINQISRSFAETAAGKWLAEHCYEYGFILRYPDGKTDETGYIGEPWHFRYVGKELAELLYNDGDWITLEDYFGITSTYEAKQYGAG